MTRQVKKIVMWILATVVIIIAGLLVLVWAITFHPAGVQAQAVVCDGNAPVLQPGQVLKVLTYNVQYMAGKNYFFWYEGGSKERPSPEYITQTIQAIARIIQAENPDVILLQEVDDGSKRTDYQDQLARLLELLPPAYKCHTSAFYWKAAFVPHPRVMGAIGHKLSIISKYQIKQATRYQLALAPADPLTQQFSPKRAILLAQLPVAGRQDLVILSTHLEVANRGSQVMQQQVAQVDQWLTSFSEAGYPWLIGGDFNLLPPGQFSQLSPGQQAIFRPQTELAVLFDRYQSLPSLADMSGDDSQQWFTFFPNDPGITAPDRTLDYFFFADNVELIEGHVRQYDTLNVSDHLPLVAEFKLP